MKVRAHVIVSGDVQGVFFRYETRRHAQKWNVHGWVRNLPEGRVEAVLEGDSIDVEKVIDFLRVGPSQAKVQQVDVKWERYQGAFLDFSIQRTV